MNLADAVNPITLRIDLAMFEPHAIIIPRAPKRAVPIINGLRAPVGGPRDQLLATLAEHDTPIPFSQLLIESGIRKSTFGSCLVRCCDEGVVVMSGTHKHHLYALNRR